MNIQQKIIDFIMNNNFIKDQNNAGNNSAISGYFIFQTPNENIVCPIMSPEYGVVDQIVSAVIINNETQEMEISSKVLGKLYYDFNSFDEFVQTFNENPKNYFFDKNEKILDYKVKPIIKDENWNITNIPEHAKWQIFK